VSSTKPIRPFRQCQIKLDAFSRTHPSLGGHVREMHGPADAVGAQVRVAEFRVDAKNHLDRVGEVELKIEVTCLAVTVLAEGAEGVLHLGGYSADRTEEVPQENE
jgi:hypothetical protein